jgi:uncharacterized lipoprotein NlpE involved in copper resistance
MTTVAENPAANGSAKASIGTVANAMYLTASHGPRRFCESGRIAAPKAMTVTSTAQVRSMTFSSSTRM